MLSGLTRRHQLYILIGVVLLSVILITSQRNKMEAQAEEQELLLHEMARLTELTEGGQANINAEKQAVIKEVVGLDLALVAHDEEVAVDFFEPAFSWQNAEEYNLAREYFDDLLGEGNAFTEVYLPPDIEVDLDGETVYRIDHRGLKVHFDSLVAVPLTNEGDRIRYVGFARYYPYKEQSDLNNLSALEASSAVIEFTVSGERGDRQVSEVEAYVGFANHGLD